MRRFTSPVSALKKCRVWRNVYYQVNAHGDFTHAALAPPKCDIFCKCNTALSHSAGAIRGDRFPILEKEFNRAKILGA
jgi:hypothetical protein